MSRKVIRCELCDSDLCVKYPYEDFCTKSKLVVYPSQVAIFVKSGHICDKFSAGTFTLRTGNIPLLNKLICLPYGGESPIKAEVWFINLLAKLDICWEMPSPIQLEDAKYGFIVPVKASGQCGIRVSDPELFLKMLVGNMKSFSSEKLYQYFRGMMMSAFNDILATKIALDGISVFDINAHLLEISEYSCGEIDQFFGKYGINCDYFSVSSVNIPENDQSLNRLKEAKDLVARLKITGKDVYQMERGFNVLESAASNLGVGSQMVGVGAGLTMGSRVGEIASQLLITDSFQSPPPLPIEETFWFVFVNGQQLGGQTIKDIKKLIENGMMNGETLVWKPGMAQWAQAIAIHELAFLFGPQTPPPPPSAG